MQKRPKIEESIFRVTVEFKDEKYPTYDIVEKTATNGGNSARVFVPKTWAGKKVVAFLLEPLDEN